MSKYSKKYEAVPIYEQMRLPLEEDTAYRQMRRPPERDTLPTRPAPSKASPETSAPANDGPLYYEIEYDSCPIPGVGKFVLKSKKEEIPASGQRPLPPGLPETRKASAKTNLIETKNRSEKIEPLEADPVRLLFRRMRDIARSNWAASYNTSKFYNKRIQSENSKIFYQQGMLMKDFEDDYNKSVPLSSYFPNYQMMGYDQLRTYFTWRTQVRQGNIYGNSLSYAFLYIYELLNNIGVGSPQDGLERLMVFWEAFRLYDQSIDRYVLKWLKDYHIYYELPHTFQEFIVQNGLEQHFPGLSDPADAFGLYCSISKYDIRKSAFYTKEKTELVQDCFRFVLQRLTTLLAEKHIILEDLIFQPVKNMTPWTPFSDALFYPGIRQPNRRIVLSEKEVYLHGQNGWHHSSALTTESGKQFIGYIFKQLESVLRKETNYRYKLSADAHAITIAKELQKSGISLEAAVTGACLEFYKEATKTIVTVNPAALEKIRQEAFLTQERLIVPEAEETPPAAADIQPCTERPLSTEKLSSGKELPFADRQEGVSSIEGQLSFPASFLNFSLPSLDGSWQGLRAALSDTERDALSILLSRPSAIKQFADRHGVMLEVLMDGINEKAADYIGDSLVDGEFAIYEDYIEQLKEMVKEI